MTLIEALVDQIIMAIVGVVVSYSYKDDFPDSFYTTGIYYAVFSVFIIGTWIRWYFQIPLMGPFSYLFE